MNISIIGLGLIGGSIAKKLTIKNEQLTITGIAKREETVKLALKLGIVDEATTDMIQGVKDADVVFICTPINLIIPTLRKIAKHLKQGAIVTDVGSSKEEIVKQANKLMLKGTCFIGGHPMAGKEKVKLEAADSSLFEGKTWVLSLSTNNKTNERMVTKDQKNELKVLEEIIKSLGAKVVKMDAKKHDLAVAGISHMPLAVAVALVNTIADSKQAKDEMKQCAASGFRDTTRIASGDPILGVDMFATNKKSVLKMLKAFKVSLSDMEKIIKSGNAKKIRSTLEKAKSFRNSIFS